MPTLNIPLTDTPVPQGSSFGVAAQASPTPLDLSATGLAAIERNIGLIVRTAAWSVPLARDFANVMGFLDTPSPHGLSQHTAALMDRIEQFEPRVTVTALTVTGATADGTAVLTLKYDVKGGVL